MTKGCGKTFTQIYKIHNCNTVLDKFKFFASEYINRTVYKSGNVFCSGRWTKLSFETVNHLCLGVGRLSQVVFASPETMSKTLPKKSHSFL